MAKENLFLECINKGFKQVIIVDTENVATTAFRNLNMLTKEDTIILMETNFSNSIKYSAICKLLKTKAKVIYEDLGENITSKNNELDFKIVAKATELLCMRKNIFVTIVSRDNGYDSALKYLKNNINKPWVRRCECITSPRDVNIDEEFSKINIK